MRMIGCRLSIVVPAIVVPGTALGVLAREAIADDAACHTHSKRSGRRSAGDLYSVEAKTASGGTDSQIWISHASGLPLRQHTVMLEQGSAKAQHDVHFDYADVRAPQSISH